MIAQQRELGTWASARRSTSCYDLEQEMKRLSRLPFSGLQAAALLALFLSTKASAQVDLKEVDSDHIAITINGAPFSDFYIGSAYPKPFMAPLRTATGLIVTRKFPMEKVAGETRDHQHHRGFWIGYGNISDINFWENEFSYATKFPNNSGPTKLGTIVLRKVDALKPGKKSGEIDATFEWLGPKDKDMLQETRKMVFYAEKDVRTIDVDFTLAAKCDLEFEDTKEGFFAIRVADSMTEKNGGLMTNSDDAQTEKNVWGKRANWVDYDGTVEGQKVGIVMFDHPDNYNHPTRWHSRAYGLFAANPFGLKDFDQSATGKGGKAMKPGDSLRFRYRIIIHPGDFPKKKIADLYAEYTKKSK
jgi:hypothetical protein